MANPKLWSWLEIAEAQELATTPNERQKFCNSILAMPFKYTKGDHLAALDALSPKPEVGQ